METNKKPSKWHEVSKNYSSKLRPIIKIEWYTEWIVYYLKRWAFIELLTIIGSFSILVAVTSYLFSADERQKQADDQLKAKHYQAWQVINSAQGKSGSAGRVDALEDLVKDKVSLDGVNLDDSWLINVSLPFIRLKSGSIHHANCSRGCFYKAVIEMSDCGITNFNYCCFIKCRFIGNNLDWSSFRGSDFRGSLICNSSLNATDLYKANFEGSILFNTKFDPDGRGANSPDLYASETSFYTAIIGHRWIINNKKGLEDEHENEVPNLLESSRYWTLRSDRMRILNNWEDTLEPMYIEPADLTGINLKNAIIKFSSFHHAILDSANLENVSFENCDLRGVSFKGVKNWRKIKSFENSVILGSELLPDGFVDFASEKGAIICYSFDGDSLLGNKTYSSLGDYVVQKGGFTKIPSKNYYPINKHECQTKSKSFELGGRFTLMDLEQPRKPHIASDFIHVWSLHKLEEMEDKFNRGMKRLSQKIVVENISDSSIVITLKGQIGIYRKCIYDPQQPEKTFEAKKTKIITVEIPPRSIKIITFNYDRIKQNPPKICFGFDSRLPRILSSNFKPK